MVYLYYYDFKIAYKHGFIRFHLKYISVESTLPTPTPSLNSHSWKVFPIERKNTVLDFFLSIFRDLCGSQPSTESGDFNEKDLNSKLLQFFCGLKGGELEQKVLLSLFQLSTLIRYWECRDTPGILFGEKAKHLHWFTKKVMGLGVHGLADKEKMCLRWALEEFSIVVPTLLISKRTSVWSLASLSSVG